MSEVTTIGLDIVKVVFCANGADAGGNPLFRRAKLMASFARQPWCRVAFGGLRPRASLRSLSYVAGPPNGDDLSGLCEALRESEQERRG